MLNEGLYLLKFWLFILILPNVLNGNKLISSKLHINQQQARHGIQSPTPK